MRRSSAPRTVPLAAARHRPPQPWPDDPVVHADLLGTMAGHEGVLAVQAPAGYGKSLLVGQWFRREAVARRGVWLTLETADGDPHTLLADLADAVVANHPDQHDLLADVHDPTLDADEALGRIGAALDALGAPPVLVLDNLERIDERSASWDFVHALVAYAHPGCAVALVSRGAQDRGTREIEATGRLLGVSQRQLLLRPSQLATLLEPLVAQVHQPWVEDAVRRCVGWPALAWLVARAAHRPLDRAVARASGEQDAVDYLHEEVLDRLPGQLRACVARLGVVEHIDQDAVDGLLAETGGRWTPDRLVRVGILPESADRGPPVHHPLLRRVLLRELQRDDDLDVWHARAAEIRLAQGRPTWALPHLLRATDHDSVSAIVREHWADLLAEGGEARLMLEWLPVEGETAANAAAAKAFGSLIARDADGFAQARRALEALPATQHVGAGPVGGVRDVLDAIAALHLHGDLPAALEVGDRALGHRWTSLPMQAMARYAAALANTLAGGQQAQRLVEPLLGMPPDRIGPWLRSLFRSVATMAMVDNEPERAMGLSLLEDAPDRPHDDLVSPFRHVLALTARSRACLGVGELDAAVRAHQRAVRAARVNPGAVVDVLVVETELELRRRGRVGSPDLDPQDAVEAALLSWTRPGALAARLRDVAAAAAGGDDPERVPADLDEAVRPSPAQQTVLEALADGGTMAEVAERLGLGIETIRSHARALRVLFGVGRTVQVVPAARDAGLLPEARS